MNFERLYEVIKNRREQKPNGSYVSALIDQGQDRVIQKVGEEAIEVVIAAKNLDKVKLISESTDLIFHVFVLLDMKDISLDEIYLEMKKRNVK